MSHSSSGLRGVTLNDLFVVTAKRATDMRSLAEPVHEKATNTSRQGLSSGQLLFNSLFTFVAHASLLVGTYTLGSFLLPLALQHIESVTDLVSQYGSEPAKLTIAGIIWTIAHLLFGEDFYSALKKQFPMAPKKQVDAGKGYIARVSLPVASISPGTLKVTYSVTADALVIRSLKDHAITVISMEMICRVFLGDAEDLGETETPHKLLISGCACSHSGDADCCGEYDPREELKQLKIDTEDKLKSWYGPDKTQPVVVSLKSGKAKIPLIIHGLYFDGQASGKGSNKKFVEEFNSALCAFRKSQVGHDEHGHDDHGQGHGGGHH